MPNLSTQAAWNRLRSLQTSLDSAIGNLHVNLFNQPRERIASLPTPFQFLPRLTAELGGPRIYIKRDDLTGLAFGGNKTRKLEYLLADAKAKQATHLITFGADQSNHVRQTAAAARIGGMESVMILDSKVPNPDIQGNLLLDALLGARWKLIESRDERDEVLEEAIGEIRALGGREYVIPGGGSNAIGSFGYISAMLELSYQLWDAGVSPKAMYFGSGSGGTQAGIELGTRMFGLGNIARGVIVSPGVDPKREIIATIADEAATMLGIPNPVKPEEITLLDGYVGEGYGVATPAALEAIDLLAKTEGILLDSVYTAKAFSGMIAEIREKQFEVTDSVIFLHTGGQPALFAKRNDLKPILPEE